MLATFASVNVRERSAEAAIALAIAAAAFISWQSVSSQNENVLMFWLFALAMFSASVMVWRRRFPPGRVVLIAVILQAIALCGAPLFEDDYYRYLWDGYVSTEMGSPYGVAPELFFADREVPARMQAVLSGVNHPEIPTIYGPTAQWLFAIAAKLEPGNERLLRALLGCLHIVLLALAVRLLPTANWWLYVLNPLVYKEIALTGHFDFLIGFGLLLTLLACQRQRWATAGAWIAVAIGAKLVAIVGIVAVLPFLVHRPSTDRATAETSDTSPEHSVLANLLSLRHWRWDWRSSAKLLATALLVGSLLYWPFLSGGASDLLGFSSFATHWQFNAGVYQLLLLIFDSQTLRWLLAAVGLGLAASLLLYCISIAPSPDRSTQLRHGALTLLTLLAFLLLCGPVFNPWYVLWLMPLALLTDSGCNKAASQSAPMTAAPAWIVAASTLSLLSYQHGLYWQPDRYGAYQLPVWTQTIEHLAIWACIFLVIRSLRSAKG